MTESINQNFITLPIPKQDISQVSPKFKPIISDILRAERTSVRGGYETDIYNHQGRFGELGYSPNSSLALLGCRLDNKLEPLEIWVNRANRTLTFRGVEGEYQTTPDRKGFSIHPSLVVTQTEIEGKTFYVCRFENTAVADYRRGLISFTMILDESSGTLLTDTLQSGLDLPTFLEEAYSTHFAIESQNQLLWKEKPRDYMLVFVLKKERDAIHLALTRKIKDGSKKPINVWVWKRSDQKLHYCK